MVIAWILAVGFNVWYCEFLWKLMATGRKPPESVQSVLKFYLGVQVLLFLLTGSLGGLIILALVLLYYMVIIPQRIWKINNNGPVA